MDAASDHRALREAVRQAVIVDFGDLAGEVAMLRRQVRALECQLLAQQALRQREVRRLRAEGWSVTRIAARLHVHVNTVYRDIRTLGLGPPQASIGVDGVLRPNPRWSNGRASHASG